MQNAEQPGRSKAGGSCLIYMLALAHSLCRRLHQGAMTDLQSGQEELVTRDLFGGALVMGMPARFMDISDFRPVPDSQEVLGVFHLCKCPLPETQPFTTFALRSANAGVYRRKH